MIGCSFPIVEAVKIFIVPSSGGEAKVKERERGLYHVPVPKESMATSEHIGARVRIKTEDGIYEGIIHQVNLNNSKLSLEKVVVVGSGKRLQGLQNFYGKELECLEYIETGPAPKSTSAEDNRREKGLSVLDKGYKYTPPHLKYLRDRDDAAAAAPPDTVETSSGEEVEAGRPNTPVSHKSGYDSGIDQEGSNRGKSRFVYTVLDKLDDPLFKEALTHISNHAVIGLALEGIDMSRNGELCWLQIATGFHVFLFDVKTLGKECFSKGLTDILQNEKILKVMHNCRLPSDILWHQYRVKLVNIFDTQVADVFVYRNSHAGDWPRYVQGLPIVLLDYLELGPGDVHIRKVRKGYAQVDEAFWAERPAPVSVLDAAVKEVVYLRELRRVLMEKMFLEYTAGVDMYLNYVRDASSTDARYMQETSHLLPKTFTDLPDKVNQSSYKNKCQREAAKARAQKVKDPNGFRENCKRLDKPLISAMKENHLHSKLLARPAQVTETPDSIGCDSQEIDEPAVFANNPVLSDHVEKQRLTLASLPDTPRRRPTAGRGSMITSMLSEVSPGAHQLEPSRRNIPDVPNPGQFESPESRTSDLEEPCGSQGPDWNALLSDVQSDLTGLILKPAGVHEKVRKKGTEEPRNELPDGKRGVSSSPQKACSQVVYISEVDELEIDCFDVIPSRKSRSKTVGYGNAEFLNFGSFTGPENTVKPVVSNSVSDTEQYGSLSVMANDHSSGISDSASKNVASAFQNTMYSSSLTPPVKQQSYICDKNIAHRKDIEKSPGDKYVISGNKVTEESSEHSMKSALSASVPRVKPSESLTKLQLLLQMVKAKDQAS